MADAVVVMSELAVATEDDDGAKPYATCRTVSNDKMMISTLIDVNIIMALSFGPLALAMKRVRVDGREVSGGRWKVVDATHDFSSRHLSLLYFPSRHFTPLFFPPFRKLSALTHVIFCPSSSSSLLLRPAYQLISHEYRTTITTTTLPPWPPPPPSPPCLPF